jgi:outer membrane protein OmpA-like peptidoglycan-associated protein
MRRWSRGLERGLAVAALAAGLAACATQSGTVVLLPEKDGRGTAVSIRQDDKELVLDQPYAAATLTSAGPRAYTSSPEDVRLRFGTALAARPERPTTFTLYFVEQTDELTAESKTMLDSVIASIARYPVPDIVVIGHTDRVGSDAVNDVLARQRAETARNALISNGIAPESIVAVGRGKREPAVPTADGVAEPRNRRVEIVVR